MQKSTFYFLQKFFEPNESVNASLALIQGLNFCHVAGISKMAASLTAILNF